MLDIFFADADDLNRLLRWYDYFHLRGIFFFFFFALLSPFSLITDADFFLKYYFISFIYFLRLFHAWHWFLSFRFHFFLFLRFRHFADAFSPIISISFTPILFSFSAEIFSSTFHWWHFHFISSCWWPILLLISVPCRRKHLWCKYDAIFFDYFDFFADGFFDFIDTFFSWWYQGPNIFEAADAWLFSAIIFFASFDADYAEAIRPDFLSRFSSDW